MINDISAYSIDSNMFTTIIRLNVPYVLMHMKGIPKTMQTQTQYNDVVAEVFQFLGIKKHELTSEGLNDIIIDPGFGFGKTIEQNFKILKNLELFEALECPILVGLSRKSLIYKTLQISPDEAITGSTVLHTIALLKRADIIRTHDVKETKQVIKLLTAYFYA
jgi:dihydropteroate synthase